MKKIWFVAFFSIQMAFLPIFLGAHCDTMDGPVILSAKKALEKGDVTPVLRWIKKQDEESIKTLFKKNLIVRTKGNDAKELADMYFFETLVRLHRAGEGAPYTGLKKEKVEPIIAATDKSLEIGSIDEVLKHLTEEMHQEIKEKFQDTLAKKKKADKSIEAGREYVEAYVMFTHYIEAIAEKIKAKGGHHHKD